MPPSTSEITEKVREFIARVLRKEVDEIDPNASLVEDLDCVSIDFIDIVFEIEDNYHIDLSMNAYDRLVELFGEGVLAVDEGLTDFGARLLQARMPDIPAERIAVGMSIFEVPKLMTPMVWVRAIEEMLSARPEKCEKCGSTDLDFDDEEIVCAACDHAMPHPTQADVIQRWAEPYLEEAPTTQQA